MQARKEETDRAGFTLVETLAALAVASSIIVGAAALIRHVALHFDHGARGVNDAERFALAMERLARDFGAASFVTVKPAGGPARSGPSAGGNRRKDAEDRPSPVAFDGEAKRLVFVSASAVGARAAAEETITLSIEPSAEERTQLVRRRAAWLGPRAGLSTTQAQDAVILLDGRFDISFSYGRIDAKGVPSWSDSWKGEIEPPRLVRLDLRDLETGESLLPGADFILRANAPASCAAGEATCLPAKKNAPDASRREPT